MRGERYWAIWGPGLEVLGKGPQGTAAIPNIAKMAADTAALPKSVNRPQGTAALPKGVKGPQGTAALPEGGHAAALPEGAAGAYGRERGAEHVEVMGGVGIVKVSGPLLAGHDEWLDWLGIEYTTYGEISEEVNALAADPGVNEIVLSVNSPGGMVTGVTMAAETIAAASRVKPVSAVVQGACCSAAYWLAAQCGGGIYATPESVTGCLGVLLVAYDQSGAAEQYGVRAVVMGTTERKGDFAAYAPIDEEMVEAEMKVLRDLHALFEGAVRGGRSGRVSAEAWTGEIFVSAAARRLGLIDGMVSGAATGGQLMALTNREEREMARKKGLEEAAAEAVVEEEAADTAALPTETPEGEAPEGAADTAALPAETPGEGAAVLQADVGWAARIEALEAAFPGEPAFAMQALKAGWSVVEAKAAYLDALRERGALKPQGSGASTADDDTADGVARDGAGAGAALGDVVALAKARAQADGCTYTEALRRIYKENPALHPAMAG